MDVPLWGRDARSADVKFAQEAGMDSSQLTPIMMGGFYSAVAERNNSCEIMAPSAL